MVVYAPLSRENREFRLAHFCQAHGESSKDGDAPIALELKQLSMNNKPTYRALSYVWGSSDQTVDIEVNGETLTIRSNLHAALTQLRRDETCSWIWIDSICIEQTNPVEKSWHVNEMGKIFSGAEQVYMWLGPAAKGSNKVMDFILHIGPSALQLGDLHKEDDRICRMGDFFIRLTRDQRLYDCYWRSIVKSIIALLRRDYWHRIWIVQEVSLARKAFVLCGRKTVELDLFDAVFTAIFELRRVAYNELARQFFLFGLYADIYDTIKCIDVWREHRKHRNVLLGEVLLQYKGSPQRPCYTATDPRDIVFGILGVISDLADMNVCADYSKSTAEVFASVARAMIYRYDQDPAAFPFHLGICNPTNSSPDLPSWVLDFRKVGQHGLPKHTIYRSLDPLVLRRRGCQVDVVTEVMTPPRWYNNNGYELFICNEKAWLESIMEFADIPEDPSPAEDYVWWMLLQGSERWGAGYLQGDDNEIAQLIRRIVRIVRMQEIRADELSEAQLNWMRNKTSNYDRYGDDVNKMARNASVQYVRFLTRSSRHRTLFKTADGRLGLADKAIRVGDLVTLIWGLDVPVILRERDNGGFEYLGEAYVNGIMYGEYLDTTPPERDFDLY
ncbi:heterokaryon incompatibility protein-domain-containing protein [Hypoxylon sp. FL1150]|nr:heterokaryon incompatibility protein-domain-containing protein [Hypoxylon sp. FL1150]